MTYRHADLLTIQRRFPTELACRQYLARRRWLDAWRSTRPSPRFIASDGQLQSNVPGRGCSGQPPAGNGRV